MLYKAQIEKWKNMELDSIFFQTYEHKFIFLMEMMKTNIELNEQIIQEAMRLSGAATKTEAVNLALQHYVAYLKLRNMKNLFGKVRWDGDLNEQRINH